MEFINFSNYFTKSEYYNWITCHMQSSHNFFSRSGELYILPHGTKFYHTRQYVVWATSSVTIDNIMSMFATCILSGTFCHTWEQKVKYNNVTSKFIQIMHVIVFIYFWKKFPYKKFKTCSFKFVHIQAFNLIWYTSNIYSLVMFFNCPHVSRLTRTITFPYLHFQIWCRCSEIVSANI